MHHLLAAFQKLIIHLLTIQKILMLLCYYTTCLNTAKFIGIQQEVYGIIIEMNQIVDQNKIKFMALKV